jgi:hypothetical protein
MKQQVEITLVSLTKRRLEPFGQSARGLASVNLILPENRKSFPCLGLDQNNSLQIASDLVSVNDLP